MEENKNNEWEKEFDKRFTDSSIDFRYKGDRDVMKYEISKIIAQDRENQKKTIREEIKESGNPYFCEAHGHSFNEKCAKCDYKSVPIADILELPSLSLTQEE